MDEREMAAVAKALGEGTHEGLMQALMALAAPRVRDAWFEDYWARKRERCANPLAKLGQMYFSQSDEDGILLEICRRLGLGTGTFLEMGVGNGLENNSLVLLMHGWRGAWIGGEPLAFEVPRGSPLSFQQDWITRENCAALAARARAAIGGQPSVFSLDLDGNDYHVLEALLMDGLRPEVLALEYNGKFPPPVRWSMPYDARHVWDGSDYFGASLQSLADLLEPAGYRLVACNLTGSNAFFVKATRMASFEDVPRRIGELFVAPDYNWFVRTGHGTSPRTIASFLAPRPA